MKRHQSFVCLLLGTVIFIGISLVYVSEKADRHALQKQKDALRWKELLHRKYYGLYSTQVGDGETMDEAMAKRRWTIDRICRHLWLNTHSQQIDYRQLDHIIVDDKRELLYCYVPKVACTNWKRIFMILKAHSTQSDDASATGVDIGNVSTATWAIHQSNPLDILANDSHRQNLFATLDKYDDAAIEYRLRHYFKFLFVRHPFERLVSAYRNKFQQNYSTYFQQRFGRLIVKNYRLNASEESLLKGNDVTFAEFVRYLLDPETVERGPLNEHWRPVYHLCHPCFIRYDVIGKYEGLDVEAQYVLQRAGVKHLVRFPKINRTVDTLDLVEQHFANLTRSSAFKLYQMYALDFKMFGYKYPEFDSYLPD